MTIERGSADDGRIPRPTVLTSEFRQLVDGCRKSFSGGKDPFAQPPAATDWAAVVRLARFHRVQALLWNSIQSAEGIPQPARDALSADAREIIVSNLRSAAECRRLAALFDKLGVDHLFVKGLTLGMLAYGTISTKAGVDIDILVDPRQLKAAAGVLRAGGYSATIPPGAHNPSRLDHWHRHRKESVWLHEDGELQVDLHTRLSDNPRLIAEVGLRSPRQMVEVSSQIVLPTLATDELFAYLAVHGASSAWFRLKWITDFAALIARQSPEELDRLYSRSQELGAGRAAGQALLLADILYDSLDQAEPLKARLESDRGVRWLGAMALRLLTGKAEPAEPTSNPFGTVSIHFSQLLLLPGIGFKTSEIARQLRVLVPR